MKEHCISHAYEKLRYLFDQMNALSINSPQCSQPYMQLTCNFLKRVNGPLHYIDQNVTVAMDKSNNVYVFLWQ